MLLQHLFNLKNYLRGYVKSDNKATRKRSTRRSIKLSPRDPWIARKEFRRNRERSAYFNEAVP